MRTLCFAALGLLGCASAPAPASPPPPPTAVASAAPAPLASASPPATSHPAASASAAAPPPPASGDEEGHGTPLFSWLADPKLPDAPCDLSRVYRGTVGKSSVTLRLSLRKDLLVGLAHYDLPGPPIELSGSFQGGALLVQEKGGGQFKGSCDGKTGRLSGTYTLRSASTPFSFVPRLPGEAAIHAVNEEVSTKIPVPAHCAKLGKTTETKVTENGICLPNDPKALAELQGETGVGLCSLALSSPRVFGLDNPSAERLANAALTHDGFGYAAADVRAGVRHCTFGSELKAGGGFSVVFNHDDVLSVFFSGFVLQTNAAHGASFGPEGVMLDLRSGRRLSLGDLVTNEQAFRDAILACAHDDKEVFSWGEKDSSRTKARWVIVPGGIAVVGGDFAPIMHGAEGKGPIASFEGLAGRHLLRDDSPVARLWAGVKAAPANADLCPTWLGMDEILKTH